MAISCPSSSGPQMRASEKLLRASRTGNTRLWQCARTTEKTRENARRDTLAQDRRNRGAGPGRGHVYPPSPNFCQIRKSNWCSSHYFVPPGFSDLLTAVQQQFCICTYLLQLTKYYTLQLLSVSSSIELHGLRAWHLRFFSSFLL
jgi:hypothetical protein